MTRNLNLAVNIHALQSVLTMLFIYQLCHGQFFLLCTVSNVITIQQFEKAQKNRRSRLSMDKRHGKEFKYFGDLITLFFSWEMCTAWWIGGCSGNIFYKAEINTIFSDAN